MEIKDARASGRDTNANDDGNGAGVEIEALRTLLQSKDMVNKLRGGEWQEVEVDYLLLGFVKEFPCVVVLYHRVDGGFKELNTYGNECNKESTLQELQQVAGRHFDILSKKD